MATFKYYDEATGEWISVAGGGGSGSADIPITSEIPANADVWIDPTDEDGGFYTKNEVDALLANLDVGGAGMTMDLLWENPDPTAEFAAQNLSLDMDGYDFIELVCFQSASYQKAVVRARVDCVEGKQSPIFLHVNTGSYYRRMFVFNNTSSLTIDIAENYTDSGVPADNSYLIPWRVYGVKTSASGGSTVTPENVYTKDEIDAMLANAGGGSTMELLWTNNDNPINMFNGQTIEMDLSEHDAIFVEFIISASDTGNGSAFVVKNESHTTIIPVITDGSRVSRTTSFDDNGVTFSNGAHNGGSGNGFVIPVKIYGIKNGSSISTSGGIGMDLLWKNENESAEFAAQNIEIDRDSYDEIVVYTTSGDIVIPKGSIVPYLISQNSFYDYDLGGQTVYGMYSWSREIVTSTDGVLKFADCVGVGGENQDDNIGAVPYGAFNHQCKPIAIYGRNLTGATASTTQTGVQMELLWENASPSSEFAAQTVAMDLNNYELFIILGKTGSTLLDKNIGSTVLIGIEKSGYNQGAVGRAASINSTGIYFDTGYYGTNSWNGYAIPLKIYGIKGVS